MNPPRVLVTGGTGVLGRRVVEGRLVDLALPGPAGRVPDFCGPEISTLADAARGYLQAKGSRRRIFEVPVPGKTARVPRRRVVLPGSGLRKDQLGRLLAPADSDR
jgi:uncharacterized protein YbjT (DUF2867 family)